MKQQLTLDFVIPVFNEGQALHEFHTSLARVSKGLSYSLTFFYVDDGSQDDTAQVLDQLSKLDSRVKPIKLSRNFGHQAALSAGLDASEGNVLVMMDGDGEHPPVLVLEMLRLWEMGYDIVQTQRLDSSRKGFLLKRITSRLFYSLINWMGDTRITEGAADFRLMSHEAVNALRQLPEYHRFYRGMVHWIGFKTVVLPYVPSNRIAGTSKYSLRKMLRLSGDGMFSFSLVPLRLGLLLGMLFLFLAAGEILYILSFLVVGKSDQLVPGWSSLMIVLTVSSGISMLLTGILGIYVGMIFQEVKRRPLYLVKTDAEHAALQLREKEISEAQLAAGAN